jgi:hypothetical protein
MKVTVEFKDTPASGRVKHHFVAFHVDFSKEERAVIQERGMDDQYIVVPTDRPPPTRGGDFLAMIMRIVGILLVPMGIFVSMLANGANFAFILIVGGIILFVIGKMKDREAYKREASPEQRITLRNLLLNPGFVVYAETLLEAKGFEEAVKERLSEVAQSLRLSATVPQQKSYEL